MGKEKEKAKFIIFLEERDGRRSDTTNRGRCKIEKRNIQCYHCKKYGHFERECRLKVGNEGKKTNYVKENEAAIRNLFLSYNKANKNLEETWILDSRYSII